MVRWIAGAAVAAWVFACPAQAQADDAGGTLSAPGGRFVLGQISKFRRDQFLLDTKTGHVWNLICADPAPAPDKSKGKTPPTIGDCSSMVWVPVWFSNQAKNQYQTEPWPEIKP